jgi:hypothetical protein
LRPAPCGAGMSSDITRPFGRLSQRPGYISDSLLTRSPLCIATPCDLHVLATPPAFRLSQDQTLQLNFLAHPIPHARRRPLQGWSGLTVSWHAFILETSLSKPRELRLFFTRSLLPRRRQRLTGSVRRIHVIACATPKTRLSCKAQTFSMAFSKKMIKEDHYLACTTKMFEIEHAPPKSTAK